MSDLATLQLNVSDLKIGMYVSRLDKPWLETPFLFQGFKIDSKDDINELRKHCNHVYIDIVKGIPPQKTLQVHSKQGSKPSVNEAPSTRQKSDKQQVVQKKSKNKTITNPVLNEINSIRRTPEKQVKLEKMFPNQKLQIYQNTHNVQQEMKVAKNIMKSVNENVQDLCNQVKANCTFDFKQIKESVNPMVGSIIRNPEACMWLARLKSKDDYTYKHCLGASIWAVNLGRQIGLPQGELVDVAIGSLLCDIGKLHLPEGILNKKGQLNDSERAIIESHVHYSVQSLSDSAGFSDNTEEIISNHHERFDGSGYPNKLSGDEIPVLARIAGIADCYDAMTSNRIYAPAIPPILAVRKFYAWRNQTFQSELVEEFIQAVGLYPVGTLVELSDNRVGVVVSENTSQRLRPKLLMLLNPNKKPLKNIDELDLAEVNDSDSISDSLFIKKTLSPGSYGIDPENIYF